MDLFCFSEVVSLNNSANQDELLNATHFLISSHSNALKEVFIHVWYKHDHSDLDF